MLLLSHYIRKMPADTTCHQFCVGATKAIRLHYLWRFPVKRMKEHPEERLCASVIIYSRLRREVWMVGDCQCLIGGEYFDNPKPYEQELAEMRVAKVRELLAQGVPQKDLLKQKDPAREVMIPSMLEVMQNQNVTYAVVDGFPIPESKVRVLPLDFQKWQIVFASDGYPKITDRLSATNRPAEHRHIQGH